MLRTTRILLCPRTRRHAAVTVQAAVPRNFRRESIGSLDSLLLRLERPLFSARKQKIRIRYFAIVPVGPFVAIRVCAAAATGRARAFHKNRLLTSNKQIHILPPIVAQPI